MRQGGQAARDASCPAGMALLEDHTLGQPSARAEELCFTLAFISAPSAAGLEMAQDERALCKRQHFPHPSLEFKATIHTSEPSQGSSRKSSP